MSRSQTIVFASAIVIGSAMSSATSTATQPAARTGQPQAPTIVVEGKRVNPEDVRELFCEYNQARYTFPIEQPVVFRDDTGAAFVAGVRRRIAGVPVAEERWVFEILPYDIDLLAGAVVESGVLSTESSSTTPGAQATALGALRTRLVASSPGAALIHDSYDGYQLTWLLQFVRYKSRPPSLAELKVELDDLIKTKRAEGSTPGSPLRRRYRFAWESLDTVQTAVVAPTPSSPLETPERRLDPELPPYWLSSRHERRSSRPSALGANLPGRSFVLMAAREKPEPRYGRLTILSFTTTELRERRPMVDARYSVGYEGASFSLRKYGQRFHISDMQLGGRLRLVKNVGGMDPVEYEAGQLFELDRDTLPKLLEAITNAERGEIALRRSATNRAGAEAQSIDFHDLPSGQVLDALYRGTLESSGPEAETLIAMLYVSYHAAYGEIHAQRLLEAGEPATKIEIVHTRRNWSGPLYSWTQPVAVVRDRYLESFQRARQRSMAGLAPTYFSRLGIAVELFQQGSSLAEAFAPLRDAMDPVMFRPAWRGFLQSQDRKSATVLKIEENLQKYLSGQPPRALPALTMSPDAALSEWSPWRSGKSAVEEYAGVRWNRPAQWHPMRAFPPYQLWYSDADDLVTTYVSRVDSKFDQLEHFKTIAKDNGLALIASLKDPAIETFESRGGLTGRMVCSPGRCDALVEAGAYTWVTSMQGPVGRVEAQKPVLAEFFKSWSPIVP